MAPKNAPRSLTEYAAKRDFTRSPEPNGKSKSPRDTPVAASFCVQKHLASHLHYDFRLEHRGVLLSWAVPKGPSLNPADKRMAVHVEDHPLDYGAFEGVIPSGYGAGIVLLWDRGTWTPEAATADIDAALAKGELKFTLDGVKLKGSWVLVRTHRQQPGRPEQWLLIKHRDRWAGDVDVTQVADSVKSFGDLSSVLAAHGTPADWATHPPVRGGEAGRLLKEVMTQAECPVSAAPARAAKPPREKPSPRPAASLAGVGARVVQTNRHKVLFPRTGFTKGDLIDYYTRVAPLMLPQLAGRAVTFRRFPDGVDGKSFFEKRCAAHRPPWLRTVRVPGETADGKTIDYCSIDNAAGLQWAANQAAIELHVPLALAAEPDRPTALIFDLDPGPSVAAAQCITVALRIKTMLDELGLKSMPKTSGGKGLHVLVPLNTAAATFAATKSFARAVALTLQQDDPKGVTAIMAKSGRTGRVFIDWSQNDRDKTNACIFSVRARERPTVSWPLDWKQLAGSRAMPEIEASGPIDEHRVATMLKILKLRQDLPTA